MVKMTVCRMKAGLPLPSLGWKFLLQKYNPYMQTQIKICEILPDKV